VLHENTFKAVCAQGDEVLLIVRCCAMEKISNRLYVIDSMVVAVGLEPTTSCV